jgi:hypothetical protein
MVMNSLKLSGKLSGIAAVAALVLANGSSIAFGAPGQFGSNPGASADTPELQSAAQRVDGSRTKLDQARQQLSAARAMLKAAEAEFKAAKADQDALALRTQARKLADASGLQESSSASATRLYPANLAPPAVTNITPSPSPVGAPVSDLTTTTVTETTDLGSTSVMPPVAPLKGAPVPNQL